MKNRGGIYQIENLENGKCYVGSAINFAKRWKWHRHDLRAGEHHSRHLQNAWNKYGETVFRFHVVLVCAPCDLLFYEQAWMDSRKPEYNVSPSATSRLGAKATAETRAKISAAHKGKPKSLEHRAALSSPKTEEHRAKLSAALLGRPLTAQRRANMSSAKMGNTNALGSKQSAETIAKRVANTRGKKRTPEQIASMVEGATGKKRSIEARANIAAGAQKRWREWRERNAAQIID